MIKDTGFRVNWRTLLIGLDGPGKYPPLITIDEILSFADEQLASLSTPPEGAVAIAVASSEDASDIRAVLQKFADEEKIESVRELRKWRLVLLKDVMARLPEDPLYGLLALTECWERFDFPSDSPHIVQGRGNQIAPAEYFTEDNYRYLVQKHKDWIRAEAAALRR